MTDPTTISAIIIDFTGRTYTRAVADEGLTEEVHNHHHIQAKDAGCYRKTLFPQSTCHRDHLVACMERAVSRAETRIKAISTPYDYGRRLLATTAQPKAQSIIDEETTNLQQLKAAFTQNYYEELIAKAALAHNGTFKRELYPAHADELAAKFEIAMQVMPFPTENHFISGIAAEAVEQFKTQQAQQLADTVKFNFDRLLSPVAHLITFLGNVNNDPEARTRFCESLLGNISDVVDNMKFLNVTNDPNLNEATTKLQETLQQLNTEGLKESLQLREQVS